MTKKGVSQKVMFEAKKVQVILVQVGMDVWEKYWGVWNSTKIIILIY